MRFCQVCSEALSPMMRADARFCSGRCRVAAHRKSLPSELTTRNRWVRRDESKRPLTVDGKPAASTRAKTWATYEQARASDAGVGLGFVLNGDGIVCIDIDHCIGADGELAPIAADIVARCPGTYIERSPSGDGLHIWGTGVVHAGRQRTIDGVGVEVYGVGRYITVNGDRWRGAANRLAPIDQKVLDASYWTTT